MASLALSIGLIASLNRAEDWTVPRCPVESMITPTPFATVTPLMPAIYVAVSLLTVPIRIVLDSPAIPRAPISMLLLPVVRLAPALLPTAMLNEPVVLFWRAEPPLAVFWVPVVLEPSALVPLAVLPPPLLLESAPAPLAVLVLPVVLVWSAPAPLAVL